MYTSHKKYILILGLMSSPPTKKTKLFSEEVLITVSQTQRSVIGDSESMALCYNQDEKGESSKEDCPRSPGTITE